MITGKIDTHCLIWSNDGSKFASGYNDHIAVYDSLLNPLFLRQHQVDAVYDIALNNDQSKLVFCDKKCAYGLKNDCDLTITIVDLNQVQDDIMLYKGLGEGAITLSWQVDDFLLASMLDGTINVWTSDYQESFQLEGHSSFCTRLLWDANKRFLLSPGADDQAIIWDMKHRAAIYKTYLHNSEAVGWSPSGTAILIANEQGLLQLKDIFKDQIVYTLQHQPGIIRRFVWNVYYDIIIGIIENGECYTWNASTGSFIIKLPTYAPVLGLAASPISPYTVLSTTKDSVLLWDFANPEKVKIIDKVESMRKIYWQPNGNKLLGKAAYDDIGYLFSPQI